MKTPGWFLKKNIIAVALLPFSIIYYLISKIVYFYRLFKQKSSKRPVICVGNILAGGVGKTPIVREIALKLNSPVVMRGYKKSTCDIGDEAKMLQGAGIDVYVGDRLKNIEYLNKKNSKKPIIMDDGFQNPIIKKDLSILVFDSNIGVGNGFVLPSGPLREPLFATRRADAILIIGNGDFKINSKLPVFFATNKTINPIKNRPFIAFSGIGFPQKFFCALKPQPIKTFSYPDHYQYTDNDLEKLIKIATKENAQLLTTEKDWVRIPDKYKEKIKFAKLETSIEPAFWGWIRGRLK